MSPEQPPDRYDPFDTDAPKRRGRVSPRLVDYTRPAPQQDHGAPVPRPHQPQVRVRPEKIVPDEDNPMSLWQRVGLSLLTKTLWPRDANRNPVMVYYSGRQRGRIIEDAMGFLPWLLLIALDVYLVNQVFLNPTQFFIYAAAKTILLLFMTSFLTIGVVSAHVRKSMRVLPLEEMLMTRLKVHEIVQGIVVRPMAVQAFCVAAYSVFQFITALALFKFGLLSEGLLIVAMMLPILHYQIMITAVELGGAMGLRAHLCIRQTGIAMLRSFLDMGIFLGIFMICLALSLLLFGIFLTLSVFLGLILIVFGPILPTIIMIMGFVAIFRSFSQFLQGEASEAMQWCYNNRDEWWACVDENDIESVQRTLTTPWRAVQGERKIRFGRRTRTHLPERKPILDDHPDTIDSP